MYQNCIMIVDAAQDFQERLQDLLPRYGFECFDTASESIQRAKLRKYTCIFLSDTLLDGSGMDVLRQLYDPQSGITQSPIVMMIEQGAEAHALEAFRFGAQDYIVRDDINRASVSMALQKACDLHEHKRSRFLAEQEMTHVRKMEAIGQLTSGIAHDFNNLLTVIKGNTHLLKRRLNNGLGHYSVEDIADKIEAINTVTNKGIELVRRMMVFTRQSDLEQEVVNLSDCINDTISLLRATLDKSIEINCAHAEDIWDVLIDPEEFANMLINFAVNARDAMPMGGKFTVEVENIVLDDAYTLRHPGIIKGAYVMLAISDTGTGMSPEVAARIFEPFFTTKPAGEGTGLGMSMAYGFIKQSGGYCHVYTEPGHGTVFRVYLPRYETHVENNPVFSKVSTVVSGKTVLVVEDDKNVREVTVAMLERLGHKTLQVENGSIAFEVLQKEHHNIDMVFTDIVMPSSMNGVDLAARIHQQFPDIKVLVTSGYTENSMPDETLPKNCAFISKPFRYEALAEKIKYLWKIEEREAA